MIEGTSNPFGSIWAANLVRRTLESGSLLPISQKQASGVQSNWKFEALIFSTNFRMGFDVEEFQTILPKNLIHHVIPGEEIYDFFEAWKRSANETAALKTYGTRQWFVAAAEALGQKGYKVNLQKKFLSRGYLVWER